MNDHLLRVRDDLLELSGLFARVCAGGSASGVAIMRSIYRNLASTLLPRIDAGENIPADEREAIRRALANLRERRVMLDDDLSEARLRLDARLVMLERHLNDALDWSPYANRDSLRNEVRSW